MFLVLKKLGAHFNFVEVETVVVFSSSYFLAGFRAALAPTVVPLYLCHFKVVHKSTRCVYAMVLPLVGYFIEKWSRSSDLKQLV